MLNRRDGLFVRITSKIEGGASFMKHVEVLIRLVKSNMSHTVCKGWDLSGFTRCSKIVNKTSIRHRRWPIDADNRPFAATNRYFNGNAFYML